MPDTTPVFSDLVRETSSTKGTDPFALDGAMAGFKTFAGAVAPGETFHYHATNLSRAGESESGVGTMLPDGRIERAPSGQATDFSSGTKAISLVVGSDWYRGVEERFEAGPGSFLATGTGAIERPLVDKMGDHVSVRDFGAVGDGVADDTAAIQAAFDAHHFVYVPEGIYRVTATLKTRDGLTVQGAGDATVLVGDDIAGPILITHPTDGEDLHLHQRIDGLSFAGTAACAVAFTHCIASTFSDLRLKSRIHNLGFTGPDGFVYEYFWSSRFSGLYTHGAAITNACHKFNRVILNSQFELLYTSNFADYNFLFDGAVTEYSTGTGVGTGQNIFRNCAAQGANRYGVRLFGHSGVVFDTLYCENAQSALNVESGSDFTFRNCDFQQVRGDATHDVWIDQTGHGGISGLTFERCIFANIAKVIGAFNGGMAVMFPRLTGNNDFFSRVERTADTPSNMPLSIYQQRDYQGEIILKTDAYGWFFGRMRMANVAGIAEWAGSAIEVPPVTAHSEY